MSKFNVEVSQNVEVSAKIPSEKTPSQQLEIMKDYTRVHKDTKDLPKAKREIECLKVLYPTLFRQIQNDDKIAGRLDFLPIGFGCVTSVGGVGHYCVFSKLKALENQLGTAEEKQDLKELYNYWLKHDLKTLYCNEIITDGTIGPFIDCEYPLIATARLSGMMLNYHKLMELGIKGLREEISTKLKEKPNNNFLEACLEALDLFVICARHLQNMVENQRLTASHKRKAELDIIWNSLEHIKHEKPTTFHQALQLFWLFALLAGVINYGRMDDVLGPFLKHDLENKIITEHEAFGYLKSLWTLIENRRTTVNGRIIVGGKGRRHPEAADVFLKLAMKVTQECRYVEPQFTLRVSDETSEEIFDIALELLGQGVTYPTLYNDEVNIPAVMHAMRVDEQTAQQYVPFGCGEFVIQGQSTGTPNTCINLLKLLTITLNQGVDPVDNLKKCGPIRIKPLTEYRTFQELYDKYKELLNYYFDLSVKAQYHSYKVMNSEVSFLFTSILMDDCIERGRAVLDGGIRYLGGTNETYGNINTSDALYAIKKLVFDTGKYSLAQLHKAALANFEGYERIRKDLLECAKYGNDIDEVDELADDLFRFVANGIRDRGIKIGMDYYLIVISNNQLNTEWGRRTGASLDGRPFGFYMNPANNPQGGADKSGPTAMLNSISKFEAKYHGGSVQNIKFSPKLFNEQREKIKAMIKGYFKRGGCQLMVTVVDRGVLEDAVKHPELYPNLLVRVSGFSAVFVNLEPDVQKEIMSRVLYE